MTTVAILQPTYLPWLGYWDIIDQADTVILLDTVQFSRQSWHHRNRILTPNGVTWLTVPVLRGETLIQDARIDNTNAKHLSDWRRKHIRTILQTYGSPRHITSVLDGLLLTREYLAVLTTSLILRITTKIGIKTPIVLASDIMETRTDRVGRLEDLLTATFATEFLEPAGGRDLYGTHIGDVPIRFHEYEPQPYEQNGNEFVPYLSVIDCLARHGPAETLRVIRAGRAATTP